MAEFPALPLWTDAYLGDTTHLTTIEHGAFLLLLFTAWRTSTYDLPDDDYLLARYCRMTARQWLRIKPTIMAYWKLKDGRWSNGRLLDERDAVRRKVAQRSDAGKASALKRLHRNSTDVQRNPDEIPTSKATPISKVSKKKDIAAVAVLPDWIPNQSWEAFKEMRVGLRFPLKGRAEGMAISELSRLRDQGHDPGNVLDQSTRCGYRGLFPIKQEFANGSARKPTNLDKNLNVLYSLHSRGSTSDD